MEGQHCGKGDSHCLKPQHLLRVLVCGPAATLPILLPTNTSGKTQTDGPTAWASAHTWDT